MAARSVDLTLFVETHNMTLIKVGSHSDAGEFTREPPSPIGNGAWNWRGESDGFLTGVDGWVRYFPVPAGDSIGIPSPVPDDQTIYLHWDNPFSGHNHYDTFAPGPFVLKPLRDGSGNDAQMMWALKGADGPDTCAPGYVWREAFPGDHVCVTPDVRDQAQADNAEAAQRVDPNGAYGPQSCQQGFVWRVASPDDLVCVTPDVRAQVAEDNATASQRVL